MTKTFRWLALVAVLFLVVAACGDDDGAVPTTTEGVGHEDDGGPNERPTQSVHAAEATITIDGDVSDWDGIDGLDLTLKPIETESVEDHDATVKVAFDGEFLYMLLSVSDDYDWTDGDPHKSGSPAVMWLIDQGAGPHMGTEAEGEEDDYESLGMVDIWHWELGCGPGVDQGGATAGLTEGTGNDGPCNFDDEWSTDPETREDDNGDGAENSLLGVFAHSSPTNGEDGTWFFEMRRRLQTGDAQDAQFAAGETALLALAYWDADNTSSGWNDAEHVQSSYLGWIEVELG